jgi:predicted SnoaL-like aldol condensation-catalyzing enzyme
VSPRATRRRQVAATSVAALSMLAVLSACADDGDSGDSGDDASATTSAETAEPVATTVPVTTAPDTTAPASTVPPTTTPATTEPAPTTAPAASDGGARAVVDEFVADVWIAGSPDAAAEFVAPDVDRLPAPDGLDALVADLNETPVTGVEVHTVIAQDDRVAVLFTRDDAAAPGGRFEGLDVYTVTDGLITGIIQLTSTANSASDPAALPPTPTRAPAPADQATIDANVALLTSFFTELFGNGDPTAADRYVAEGYLQHNPSVAPGREGLKALVAATGPTPLTGLGSLGTIAEGDFVVNVSELPVGPDFLLVDVFRVEDGLLAEHWDFTPLGTTLPAPPPG